MYIIFQVIMQLPKVCLFTPSKNNLFRKSNARTNGLHHEFNIDQGIHQGKSRINAWSLMDDFTQPFSWRSPLARALDFLNKLFLPAKCIWPCPIMQVSFFFRSASSKVQNVRWLLGRQIITFVCHDLDNFFLLETSELKTLLIKVHFQKTFLLRRNVLGSFTIQFFLFLLIELPLLCR